MDAENLDHMDMMGPPPGMDGYEEVSLIYDPDAEENNANAQVEAQL